MHRFAGAPRPCGSSCARSCRAQRRGACAHRVDQHALLERARIVAPPADERRLAQVRRSVESARSGAAPPTCSPACWCRAPDPRPRPPGRLWQPRRRSLTFSLALPLTVDWPACRWRRRALAEALDPRRRPRAAASAEVAQRPVADGRRGSGRKLGGILIETVAAGSRRSR
jgi:BirA family biotin operon repressor/biotin-[acetyl-CoA-carboxylase] ligase